MTVPTLYNFTEALQAPDLAFSTLRDCHPRRTATGGVALSRTSRFAEAEIEWQSRKYLLCFPLSTASIFAVEQTAARLRFSVFRHVVVAIRNIEDKDRER